MIKDKKEVYLDYSATTYVKPKVLEEMLPYFTENFGNPSSLYNKGLESKIAIKKARKIIANYIGANENEIYFTSSGSEGNNWVLKSNKLLEIALSHKYMKPHIITTEIEHHSILNSCEFLKHIGVNVTYLKVDNEGFINLNELEKAITPETILVSIMFANNEIGTIEPIKEIGKLCARKGILFHTDATQAIGHIKIDVEELNIDALTFSGHKLYAPKGIGCVYIRAINDFGFLNSFIHGGKQEYGLRAGTENVSGIVGLGKAIELLDNRTIREVRDYCLDKLKDIEGIELNGTKDLSKRLDCNINIIIKGVENESLINMLSLYGIYVSSGSACNSGSLTPSHVLKAIGLSDKEANSSIRITIGEETTKEDIDYFIDKLKISLDRIKNISKDS